MGKAAKIAGVDHCAIEVEDDLNDLDLGPAGLVVENGSGHAAENDPTKA